MTPANTDKRRIAAAFNRAAPGYAANAVLQNRVAGNLADRLELFRIAPARVLDAGSGCGNGTGELKRRFPKAQVLAFDLALEMLRTHRGHGIRRWFAGGQYVCGDVERLPFADRSIDLIFSSLALQWSTDLDATLAEFARVLRPGGLLLFSSLGPDTLRELRASWAAVDAAAHVNTFLDMHDVGDRLIHAGFSGPVLDVEHVTMTYADVTAVLRDLRSIGADQVLGPRNPRLTSPGRMRRMIAEYENHRRDGLVPATYEVVYAHAWAAAAGDRPQDGSTVARFPVSALRRRPTESAPR